MRRSLSAQNAPFYGVNAPDLTIEMDGEVLHYKEMKASF